MNNKLQSKNEKTKELLRFLTDNPQQTLEEFILGTGKHFLELALEEEVRPPN